MITHIFNNDDDKYSLFFFFSLCLFAHKETNYRGKLILFPKLKVLLLFEESQYFFLKVMRKRLKDDILHLFLKQFDMDVNKIYL